jgi:hypothetical protein
LAQCLLQRPLLQSSLHLHEDAVWGGSCGGSYSR